MSFKIISRLLVSTWEPGNELMRTNSAKKLDKKWDVSCLVLSTYSTSATAFQKSVEKWKVAESGGGVWSGIRGHAVTLALDNCSKRVEQTIRPSADL